MSWTKAQRMMAILSTFLLILIYTLTQSHVSPYSRSLPNIPGNDNILGVNQSHVSPYSQSLPSIPENDNMLGVNQSHDGPSLPSIPENDYQSHVPPPDPSLPSIPENDNMPLVKYIKSREELQKTEWVPLLYNFLQTVNKSVSPHVNVVFGDDIHIRLLENWITAALKRLKPPLHNVMVLSLDYSLCKHLSSKKLFVTCIPVPEKSLVASHPKGKEATWNAAMMIRRVVLRLINYWGYDVASYDSDAVLLQNPQILYDAQPHVDVFAGSSKRFPLSLSDKWGFNLCGGVLMLRASPAVEALWRNISAVVIDKDLGEQKSLNFAVEKMGVMWNRTTKIENQCSVNSGWRSKSVINIFVFPQYQMCRHCCKRSLSYESLYIAHPATGHVKPSIKEKVLKNLKAWFL